jgi:hypothetical protein
MIGDDDIDAVSRPKSVPDRDTLFHAPIYEATEL